MDDTAYLAHILISNNVQGAIGKFMGDGGRDMRDDRHVSGANPPPQEKIAEYFNKSMSEHGEDIDFKNISEHEDLQDIKPGRGNRGFNRSPAVIKQKISDIRSLCTAAFRQFDNSGRGTG